MKILYFIGNGFDLNLGLNTRYKDFYKYYQTVKSNHDSIIKLKQEISGDIENWADLELALGDYTKNIKTTKEFDDIYSDIEDRLAEFLQDQERKYNFQKADNEKFLMDLMYPDNYLTQADKIEINELRKSKANIPDRIDIITFNYTRSIEKILGDEHSNIFLKNKKGLDVELNKVEHIHGYLDKRMIMGVNDISQIANTIFHSEVNVLETLVKNDCNKIIKDNVEKLCKYLVNNADLICIFGSSIGDTDKLWWEMIANQLGRHGSLIIFEKGEKIPARRLHLIGRRERQIKDYFLSKTNLSDDDKEKILGKIYVPINTTMFDLKKVQSPVANSQ